MANVLQVVNNGALGGGIGTVLGYLAQPGNMEGYSHSILRWYADHIGREGHETVERRGRQTDIRSLDGLAKELAGYDVLHIHSIPSYRVLEAIDLLRQQGRCPKIVNTCHSSVKKEIAAHLAKARGTLDGEEVARMVQQGMLDTPGAFAGTYWGSSVFRQERIMTVADRVQHMSDNYLEDTVNEYGARDVRGKHGVVYNGIEVLPETQVVDRPRKKRILYSGRFAQEKGISEFVDSLPRIFQAHPDAEVRLMGGDKGGWTVESVRSKVVEQFRQRFGLEAGRYLMQVGFTGWLSDPKKIADQYDWCDFVVVPSKDESFCLAIAEALNHRRIPIMTNTRSLNELYLSHSVGLPIDPDQRHGEGIANVVNAALGNMHEPWMEDMAKRGRQLVARKYSLEEVLQQQRRVYDEVLGRV